MLSDETTGFAADFFSFGDMLSGEQNYEVYNPA